MHADIHVFTFKTGLLARVAHDLRLRVQRYELHVQEGRVRGHCDATSLVVEGVMSARGLDSAGLSARDKQQIEDTIRSEILCSEQHPRVELQADITMDARNVLELQGELRVRGRAQPVRLRLEQQGDHLHGAVELTPSAYGIAPYKALGGAIKLQDRVRVQVDIPLAGQDPRALLGQAHTLQP